MKESIQNYIQESIALQEALLRDDRLALFYASAVEATLRALRAGSKIMVAGNGGSAADAQHFAAEFVGKYKMVRKALPAISLTVDTSTLTAWSNDNSFDDVFARQIEALGKPGDIFFGITTSGNSKNILAAFAAAKRAGMVTVALLGGGSGGGVDSGVGGGAAKGVAELEFVVPSKNTPRIQEVHTLILHSIAEEVEKSFFP